MSEWKVRRADEFDADRLREIRLLALQSEPDAYGSTYEESVRFPQQQWTTMAQEWNYFLALRNDEVLGMASGGLNPSFPDTRWLYGMFVHERFRGTGVAQTLVRTVADWARGEGVHTLGLHVTTTVLRARAFYEKVGFVASGEVMAMDRDHHLKLQVMTTNLDANEWI